MMYPLPRPELIVDNVLLNGRRTAVSIASGLVVDIDRHAPSSVAIPVLDGRGGRIIPGLADHHLHLYATAAQAQSVDVSGCTPGDLDALQSRIALCGCADQIRATGMDDGGLEPLQRLDLDAICPDKPLRIQYRTGSLWVLNSVALEALPRRATTSPHFERDSAGELTGRVWRGDALLRSARLGSPPDLTGIGQSLAGWGVTSVTDASITNDQTQAERLGRSAGCLPQKVILMGQQGLVADGSGWRVGPRKIVLDETDLPDFDSTVAAVRDAHLENRCVAVHCVTVTELMFMLAVCGQAGVVDGDRIEHGSLVPTDAMAVLADMRLTVVGQPGFLLDRGDRYIATLTPADRDQLLPLRSLRRAGVRLAAGSDAPYGPLNPWLSIKAAVNRRSRNGVVLNSTEALSSEQALGLYLGPASNPGLESREIRRGSTADLVVLKPGSMPGLDEDPVMMTIIDGHVVYRDGGDRSPRVSAVKTPDQWNTIGGLCHVACSGFRAGGHIT